MLCDVLDASSPLPLYHQLARWLEEQVRAGGLREGDRIDSEPELARRFGIGRPTVRQATELLVRRGLLERRRGAGTFVKPVPPEVALFGLHGTLASFRDSGAQVDSRFLGKARSEAGQLHVSRLHVYQGTPVVLEEIRLQAELFAGLSGRSLQGVSLSRFVLNDLGMRLDHARQAFRVALPGSARGKLLACAAAAPLLHVQRELFFVGHGRAVEADLYCRTDTLELSQTLQGDTL